MEPLDQMGMFWLAGFPDDALSGRLIFNPGGSEGGIRLSLVGTFNALPVHEVARDLRIVGWVGTKQVTLDDAFTAGSTFGSGVATSNFHANRLLVGHQFAAGEALAFQSATFRVSGLRSWVNDRSTSEEWANDRKQGEPIYTITFTPPEVETAHFSRGTVEMILQWQRTTDDQQSLVWRTEPAITITYDDLQPFEVIRKDVGRVQSLISLCLDKSTMLDGLIFTRPDVRAISLAGTDMGVDQPIELRVPLIRYDEPSRRREQHEFRMLLPYSGFGGVNAVARWLDGSRPFQRALDSLMSVRFARQIYAENRYLNVTFASEAFHRICSDSQYMPEEEFLEVINGCMSGVPDKHREWMHDKIAYSNEPPLRKRMRQLASTTKPCTRLLIGDVDAWAFVVAGVRNELTHLGRKSRQFSGSDLRRLANSVFLVTGIAMLLETGVPAATLAARAECDALTHGAQELQDTVRVVRRALLSAP
ncbi:ApeA N-terminal domain 1-containing protein [Asanoa iriomotensis]|uniref:ApeA N-terminal domain-containing protein n=1 Tax=Asanoa iriomotensis TaxID=234613 RepID=A0ABQ4CF28_9ACTN|nr:HEPN domain-containing protein [Asanoa iriomotensis]GIF61378.1 hypothetical protein Air01nite_74730 [Asanoa iriomotensis]